MPPSLRWSQVVESRFLSRANKLRRRGPARPSVPRLRQVADPPHRVRRPADLQSSCQGAKGAVHGGLTGGGRGQWRLLRAHCGEARAPRLAEAQCAASAARPDSRLRPPAIPPIRGASCAAGTSYGGGRGTSTDMRQRQPPRSASLSTPRRLRTDRPAPAPASSPRPGRPCRRSPLPVGSRRRGRRGRRLQSWPDRGPGGSRGRGRLGCGRC